MHRATKGSRKQAGKESSEMSEMQVAEGKRGQQWIIQ